MNKIITALYKSRKWDNGVYAYESPMVDLVERIIKTATAKGFRLDRWQTNTRMGRGSTVTYAVVPASSPHARFSKLADSIFITVINQVEGTTTRCEAYRKLAKLAQSLETYLEEK